MQTKGIILAGGHGTRLFPLTLGTSKQLLPVYDKPMIYYPLSVLMNAGIKEILIISTKNDIPKFKNLLNNGNKLGLNISYEIQPQPNGIAESFIIASKFIGNDNVCLILGDNIFYGPKFYLSLEKAKSNLLKGDSTVFGVTVSNPEEFGVVYFNKNNEITKILEKPKNPKNNLIVSGLYFYTNDVIKIAHSLVPSKRGELEITDVNNIFLAKNNLSIIKLDSTTKWIDTGTYNSLLEASNFFQNLETDSGKKIACIEEIAFNLKYINKFQLNDIAKSMINSEYGKYLLKIIKT